MPTVPEEDNKVEGSAPPPAAFDRRQRQRMLIALGVLVLALVVVLVRDRQFLASPAPTASPATTEPNTPLAATSVAPQATTPAAPQATVPPPTPPSKVRARSSKGRKAASATVPAAPTPAATTPDTNGPVITATNRTVLPPLQVEVVAGNQHRTLPSRSNSVKVEMEPNPATDSNPAPVAPPPEPAQTSAAAAPSPAIVPSQTPKVTLSPGTAERLSRTVEPDYPLLAKQMKVQGAVVLQVLIDKTGSIQELHVVSGPTILATAAQQALKQWRFKPYYQDGQPVETEARVTVNFTISTY